MVFQRYDPGNRAETTGNHQECYFYKILHRFAPKNLSRLHLSAEIGRKCDFASEIPCISYMTEAVHPNHSQGWILEVCKFEFEKKY